MFLQSKNYSTILFLLVLQQQGYLQELRLGCHLIFVHALPLRQLYPTFILYDFIIIQIHVTNIIYI